MPEDTLENRRIREHQKSEKDLWGLLFGLLKCDEFVNTYKPFEAEAKHEFFKDFNRQYNFTEPTLKNMKLEFQRKESSYLLNSPHSDFEILQDIIIHEPYLVCLGFIQKWLNSITDINQKDI